MNENIPIAALTRVCVPCLLLGPMIPAHPARAMDVSSARPALRPRGTAWEPAHRRHTRAALRLQGQVGAAHAGSARAPTRRA